MNRHREDDKPKAAKSKASDLPKNVEELEKLAEKEEAERALNREVFKGGDFSGGHIQGPHIS